MYNPISPLKSSQPLNENVVGMFCYPKPFAPGGTIAVDSSDPRPLIIGTDVDITEDGGSFKLTISLDISLWGVNVGDYVGFSTPEFSGSYIITDMPDLATIYVAGPGAAIASGNIWFVKAKQKVTGTGTKFTRNVTAGRWVVIMDSALSPTVQACRIAKVVSDTELLVEKGFISTTDISGQAFMVPAGHIRGVSIECLGDGVVNGTAVLEDDILTFDFEKGLEPAYGDSGVNTFKILIQE
jgi:hypothetical protein